MDERQIQLVRDICHQVDVLVSKDQGTSDLEVLECARLKMNDLLIQEKWLEAESMAYAILLKQSGQDADQYLI